VVPVGAGPPPSFVHRTGGAEDQDRGTVDEGVVDHHLVVQEADEVVQDTGHRPPRRLGIAVRDLDGRVFMLADEHPR
jgi:hypothetical protein